MKPTEAQVRELWELCGLRYEYHVIVFGSASKSSGWYFGDRYIGKLPTMDSNNLIRYAVPKLFDELSKLGESYKFDRIWEAIKRALLDGTSIEDSVFWAIYPVLKEVK